VDRFFSKLDLRDIKIDPFKTSYPPDAEDVVVDDTEQLEVQLQERRDAHEQSVADVVDRPSGNTRQPHTPAWAATMVEAEPANSYDDDDDEDDDVQPFANGGVSVENGALPVAEVAAVVAHRNGDVLKVSARSRPSAVAGAIAGVVRENGRAEVQAIGAGATNQAVKAVAIARDYLRETGIEAVCLPAFIDVTIENEDRTAMRLVVEPR